MQNLVLQRENLDFRSKEAFKTLRTNIEFSGSHVKTIFFTSAIPNEGKRGRERFSWMRTFVNRL